MITVIVVAGVLASTLFWYRAHNVRVPLLTTAVVISGGATWGLAPGSPSVSLYPGSRVVRTADGSSRSGAVLQQQWLDAGTVPGRGGAYRSMVEDALLDMHTLSGKGGAPVAGWPESWRYVWPRDTAFVVAALAATGHREDALAALVFLQSVMPDSGVFQARYLPDGSGVPDARGEESDGTGFTLWAVDRLLRTVQDHRRRSRIVQRLKRLVDGTAQAALRLTDSPAVLPPPSQDYWEVHDPRLSLGTVAPLAAGLTSAADIYAMTGNRTLSEACRVRADLLYARIRQTFGSSGYPRYLGGEERDASISFLLPPFTAAVDATVLTAWRQAAADMTRPAGGLSPGAGWKNDGISWTPETALFALTAVSIGDRRRGDAWLDWLLRHATAYGALPEKVLSNGRPAGPAPLVWTDALTVLAVAASEAKGGPASSAPDQRVPRPVR